MIVYMAMSILGGLWFPVEQFSTFLQHLAKALPSYWTAEIARARWPHSAHPAHRGAGPRGLDRRTYGGRHGRLPTQWCQGLTCAGADRAAGRTRTGSAACARVVSRRRRRSRPARGPEEHGGRRITGIQRWRGGALFAQVFVIFFLRRHLERATAPIARQGRHHGAAVAFGAWYVLVPPLRVGAAASRRYGCSGGAARAVRRADRPRRPVDVRGVDLSRRWRRACCCRGGTRWWSGWLLGAAMVALTWPAPDGRPWELAVTLVALTLWMGGFAGNIRLTNELRQHPGRTGQAAVAAERSPDRPRPARHPRPLAHRDRGEGRPGPPAGRA